MSRNTESQSLLHKGLLLPALLALVAWLGGAYLLKSKVLDPRSAAQVEEASQQKVADYAAQLQQYLSRQQAQLQKSESPGGANSQLLSSTELRVGAGENPSLNFALLDLLRRSEKEAPQPVEFLRTGSDNSWQMHNALPQGEELLLISQPFSTFEGALQKLDGSSGQVRLLQKFPDGPPQTLWQAGQGDNDPASTPPAKAKVGGSHLTVEFKPSTAFAAEHGLSPRWIYIAATVGLLITLLLLLRFLPRDLPAPWDKQRKKPVGREKRQASQGTTGAATSADHDPISQVAAKARAATAAASKVEKKADAKPKPSRKLEFPQQVFRAYDIRGIAGEQIDEAFAYQLGRTLGTLALHAGEKALLVGRDGRNSSEQLANCLVEGILESGCNSIDLDLVPSPLLYYSCIVNQNTSSGVMVTASHNPAEYNGFKIVLKGRPLAEEKLQKLYQLMHKGPFKKGQGENSWLDISENYIERIFSDVALTGRPHLVVDAGNGATSLLAPRLFEQLGCAVTPLFCEIDGDFPNHAPDPSRPENLQALIKKVAESGAQLGVALDGDGDRVTLVSASGRIAWADQLVMLLARDILARNPGEAVVFDVKSSRAVGPLVNQYGGRPIMWKTGHAPMKTKMLESRAILGGELSGHIFIRDRWFGFDDGIYAAARILEIMTLREQSLDDLLDSLPVMIGTPEILIPVEEERKFALIEQLQKQGDFGAADINTIDGLRIEYADGWSLVRASNTSAALTLRFEAESDEALERIRKRMMEQLRKIDPALAVPNWQVL